MGTERVSIAIPILPRAAERGSGRPRRGRVGGPGWHLVLGAMALSACASPPRGLGPADDPAVVSRAHLPPPQPRPAVAPAPARAGGDPDAARAPLDPAARAGVGTAAPGTIGGASPDAAPATSDAGRRVVAAAQSYVGVPYRRGGRTTDGMDCSGLVQLVYSRESIRLPRTCAAQARVGEPIALEHARPGDLLFFAEGPARVSHVGIYAGGGEFIHASTGAGRVRIDTLNDRYFAVRLREARRVLP